MKPIQFLLLCFTFAACTSDTQNATDTTVIDQKSAISEIATADKDDAQTTTRNASCELCGTWNAIKVTIDGKVDDEMDPTGKVEWVIRADSSFFMRDATEGMEETLDGKWRADNAGHFWIIDPESNGMIPFAVKTSKENNLVLQVLEEEQEKVLLYFVKN